MASRFYGALGCVALLGCNPQVAAVLPADDISEGVAGSRYAAEVQTTDGLVAYFRFSEPGGTIAVDRVAGYRLNAYPGAALGEPGALAEDPEQGSASFDGTQAAYLSMPFPTSLRLSHGLTIELWLRRHGAGPGCAQPSGEGTRLLWVEGTFMPAGCAWGLTLEGEQSDAVGFRLQVDTEPNGFLEAFAKTVEGALLPNTGPDCSAGAWQHVAATFDAALPSGQMKIYVDGALTPDNGAEHPLTVEAVNGISDYDEAARLSVGGFGPTLNDDGSTSLGYPFDGWIDELAIYSRALTGAEIARHFEEGTK